jgi:hypothetical protein
MLDTDAMGWYRFQTSVTLTVEFQHHKLYHTRRDHSEQIAFMAADG